MGRFINSGLFQEPGGTAKSCWHTVHWFRAGCAWRGEWSGAPPESGAGVRRGPCLVSFRLPTVWGLGLGRLFLGFVNSRSSSPAHALPWSAKGNFL